MLHVILLIISLLCILPLIVVISASLSDEAALTQNGYSLIPTQFSLDAYQFLFRQPDQLLRSYGVTFLVTGIGTIASLLVTSLLAYPLSRKDFQLRRSLSMYILFTMLFSGGLVPSYMVVSRVFHLKDTIWSLILPYLVIAWFVFLMRTFFATIPDEIIESAKIDGVGEYRLYFQIIVPLSTPVLATIGLFCTLNYWNDWYLALLYIDDRNLIPLQYLLMNIMKNIEVINSSVNATTSIIPSDTVRMATATLAIGPIIFVYLFFQKFFVRGLTVGAVKG
ncbi:carbohydrate ABC transporter permease [Cohnella silvisoli]|uniref:Carbohydrate ABC transporter permease n=1 Tax=Cohnella silvisoli TaxID=2873699 RepID=A0ABV1L011_9BACL|nr:carbohydrate ABC transporter permease [Cohnella silvisoli]MCD9024874.1 carbohydrate ABC transporter permease [Cohnella silvisoli]